MTIPANTAPRQYNFIVTADDRNAIEERDETNNSSGVAILTVTGGTAAEGGASASGLALAAGPNPASGAVRLSYALADAGPVRLAVFDALGREVAVAEAGTRGAGTHPASLDASSLPPGVYAVRLVTAEGTASVPITVVR